MVLASPAASVADRLVFWNEAEEGNNGAATKDLREDLDGVNEDVSQADYEKRESMYVTLFEDMLKTVLTSESYLFSTEELTRLMAYDKLTYRGRYLLIRLCLRKSDTWFRLSKLKYQGELGQHINHVMQELCTCSEYCFHRELLGPEVKVEERDVIDLTLNDKHEPQAGPSEAKKRAPESETPNIRANCCAFADDETHATLRELLECLTTDELKNVVKELNKKPSSGRRDDLLYELLNKTSNQSTLPFAPPPMVKGKGKARADPMVQTTLSFHAVSQNRRKTQADMLHLIVMKRLGKCIKIKEDVVKLFRRVNLVYFRSTQYTSSLLVPSILSRAKKRSYASYGHMRTSNIWPSREALIAYEEALEVEAEIDALLEGHVASAPPSHGRSTASRTPGLYTQRLKIPITARKKQENVDGDISRSSTSPTKCKVFDESHNGHDVMLDNVLEDPEMDSPRRQSARLVVEKLEQIYPQWCDMVGLKGEEAARVKGLERFECGHILTRAVCKGTYALGVLKKHSKELEILEALLAQRRWRRGRRGRWYERRALILMTHCGKSEQTLRTAYQAVTEALLDDDTHIVFRPKLQRRLTTLEKRLKILSEDRHVCEGKLGKPGKVLISGARVHHRTTSLLLDPSGRVHRSSHPSVGEQKQGVLIQTPLPWALKDSAQKPRTDISQNLLIKATGKSIWRGLNDEEVHVEILALQHYEHRGYKGFHCEGRIISTLFGLILWDIIFADIAGAFETPYQSAPLDIADDTFYFSRKELIDHRLEELRDGHAPKLIEQVYDEHADKGTWCVGVRWDIFQKADLMEIAHCLGGSALAVICRLLCEDYAGRVGGVPDLIVWNADEQECKFVEVKGPGDKLQENQKVWIDVLLQAGIQVEVCNVIEEGIKNRPSKKRKRAPADMDEEAVSVESEEEPDVDYSQLDTGVDADEALLPVTPKKRSGQKLIAEVVITSSPPDVTSPTKKRRLHA